MRLKQWGAVLMGCAALLLTACTVVDLDENGKPVLPADPNAKPSFDHLTPQQIAQQTWQSRVIDAANQHALDATALEKSAPGVWRYATERLCPPEQRGDRD
ncbi:putative lipoprotein [Klebsiella pneumoniae IS39]|nr:putative lipoprotein [Klebsiella pneumoniae IS39]